MYSEMMFIHRDENVHTREGDEENSSKKTVVTEEFIIISLLSPLLAPVCIDVRDCFFLIPRMSIVDGYHRFLVID